MFQVSLRLWLVVKWNSFWGLLVLYRVPLTDNCLDHSEIICCPSAFPNFDNLVSETRLLIE